MKAVSKFITGAAAAAMLTVTAAAPASAQYRHRDSGIDAGDIATGVAILGGIAAITAAIGNDGSRYGYGYRNRYRDDYTYAVNACGREAERYGRGQVQITDVDRRGNNSYRVRGVIQAGYDRYDRGYDRRYDRDYGRNDYDRGDRDGFTCTVRGNGRITNFKVNDRGNYGYNDGYRRY
ncbi:MAG TPA: hypothetical protein VIT45_18535 [Allosphingosinicella sp.]